jgi:hypothetical protein
MLRGVLGWRRMKPARFEGQHHKLKQHCIGKVIPDRETLARTYEMFAASDRLLRAFDEMKERLDAESEEQISVPADLGPRRAGRQER